MIGVSQFTRRVEREVCVKSSLKLTAAVCTSVQQYRRGLPFGLLSLCMTTHVMVSDDYSLLCGTCHTVLT